MPISNSLFGTRK